MKPYFWSAFLVSLAMGCSSGNGDGANECAATNLQIAPSCNDCLRGSCCTELTDCITGTPCNTCANGSCSAKGQAELDTFTECILGQCRTECGLDAVSSNGGTSGAGGTTATGGSVTMSEAGMPPTEAGGAPDTGGNACEETDAPGQFPFDALKLDATDDCNNTPLVHAGEKLSNDDSDWFSYAVTDKGSCAVNGSVGAKGGDLQVCAFGDLGQCKLSCVTGTPANHEGYDGCCASGQDPSVTWGTTCILQSASGTVFAQVTSTGGSCLPYTLSYGF